MIRKTTAYVLSITITLSLTSCATTHRVGNGIVIAEKKINELDYKPHDRTLTGLKVGGTVGAVTGGVVGGVIGLLPGIMSGSLPGLVICTFAGSVIGATIVGLTGGTIGGGVGYAGDLFVQNQSVYEFKVKSLNYPEILTITQHSSAIPLNSSVRILEKENTVFIRKN
ncbi:MAG: hypothetical protein Q8R83_03995 [Legionellaceae bacterium]|nr:hypothetical protein [Legionellaceae bacterium]